jgi:hypothetical protein
MGHTIMGNAMERRWQRNRHHFPLFADVQRHRC